MTVLPTGSTKLSGVESEQEVMAEQRPYIKPGFLVRVFNRLVAVFGLAPILAVPGRKTGKLQRTPVYVLEHDGRRYLVSPRGETQWARNLRVAGGGELRRRFRREAFKAREVSHEEKPPLIEAYKDRWGKATRREWNALPDPADHPVFSIETVQR